MIPVIIYLKNLPFYAFSRHFLLGLNRKYPNRRFAAFAPPEQMQTLCVPQTQKHNPGFGTPCYIEVVLLVIGQVGAHLVQLLEATNEHHAFYLR